MRTGDPKASDTDSVARVNSSPVDFELDAMEGASKRQAFVRYLKNGPPPSVSVRTGREANRPHVTIIIPTTGRARRDKLAFLLRQLDSQTYQKYEVIVVRGDRRQGRAINIGAAMARGDLLVTMDDDTQLASSELLEKLVQAFAQDSTIGIAGVANVVPSDGPWVMRRAMQELPRRSSRMVDNVTDSDMAEHPCLAIRKDIFYRIGGEHEWIPRGLDPYLRREVRRLGYRVVVIPNAWIHHLLPETLGGILRQYFRNGAGAAYVKKFYPEFIVDQSLAHGAEPPADSTLSDRTLRYVSSTITALFRGRFIYAACQVTYAIGYIWGLTNLRSDSL